MPSSAASQGGLAAVLAPLLACALGFRAPAQDLTIDGFTRGATASLEYTNGTPASVAILVFGFGGTGVGFPLDADATFDLFEPTLIWSYALVPVSGAASFSLAVPTDLTLTELSAQVIELTFSDPWNWRSSDAVTEAIAPLASLSEDFESGVLPDAWSILQPGLGSVSVQGGELVLAPAVGGLPDMWYEDGEGLAVVRTLTGDFEVTCEVRVHAAADPFSPPPVGYRLGGLLVRDASPAATMPGTHEWCHVATGSGGVGQPTGVEWKQTHASSSSWSVVPASSTHRELRLVRAGDIVTAWHRDLGAAVWTQLATYTFAGLPATVEVGAMAYSNASPAQVVARFAYVDFAD